LVFAQQSASVFRGVFEVVHRIKIEMSYSLIIPSPDVSVDIRRHDRIGRPAIPLLMLEPQKSWKRLVAAIVHFFNIRHRSERSIVARQLHDADTPHPYRYPAEKTPNTIPVEASSC
jgi:hypothetical protein